MSRELHHLHKKKSHKNHSPSNILFDKVMLVGSMLAPVMVIPQVMHIWIDKQTAGVSMLTWAAISAGSVLWIVYGYIHKDRPIFYSNAFGLACALLIVIGLFVNR